MFNPYNSCSDDDFVPAESITSTSDTEILGEDNELRDELSDIEDEERVCCCQHCKSTEGKKQGDLPRNFTNYQKVEKDHGKILAKFLFIFVFYIYDKLLIIFMPIIIFII